MRFDSLHVAVCAAAYCVAPNYYQQPPRISNSTQITRGEFGAAVFSKEIPHRPPDPSKNILTVWPFGK